MQKRHKPRYSIDVFLHNVGLTIHQLNTEASVPLVEVIKKGDSVADRDARVAGFVSVVAVRRYSPVSTHVDADTVRLIASLNSEKAIRRSGSREAAE